MRVSEFVICLSACLCLTGCSYNHLSLVAVTHNYGTNYDIGKEMSAKAGAALVSIRNAKMLPAFRPDYLFQPPRLDGLDLPPIAPQQEWLARYTENSSFVITSSDFVPWFGIIISQEGEVQPSPLVNLSSVILFSDLSPPKLPQSEWHLPSTKLFSRIGSMPTTGSFRCELIYAGKINNLIELQYNEYFGGEKRPNYGQIVRYELSDKATIEFKTLKLKIVHASDSEIKFVVVEDGGLPWIPKD